MNTDATSASDLASSLAEAVAGADLGDVALAVCPPYTHLQAVGEALGESGVALGAQNVHHEESGAYTGEISAGMLTSVGCTHAIVGHSERREYVGETDALIRSKIQAAQAHDLVPILCVGETKPQRDAGDAESVVKAQLTGALDGVDVESSDGLVVAYEPVWAIGTGDTATPEQANEMHAFIRGILQDLYGADVAAGIQILYGGSMKPHNAEELLSQPDVDGGLVGGASLSADSFIAIAEHGAQVLANA
jgi:triosephosphate isomerase